jgi:hypothetical protein
MLQILNELYISIPKSVSHYVPNNNTIKAWRWDVKRILNSESPGEKDCAVTKEAYTWKEIVKKGYKPM